MQQKQIFYQTALKEISVTKNGIVRNNRTKNLLKINHKGCFISNGKSYNLAKILLQTFKKISIKKGRIKFIDNNKLNFYIDNIEYVSKLDPVIMPSEIALKKIIDFYFNDVNFKMSDWMQYRIYIGIILQKKNFFEENKKENNIDVFQDYLSFNFPNFRNLAKRNCISVLDAKRTVYFFLNKLIQDCNIG